MLLTMILHCIESLQDTGHVVTSQFAYKQLLSYSEGCFCQVMVCVWYQSYISLGPRNEDEKAPMLALCHCAMVIFNSSVQS